MRRTNPQSVWLGRMAVLVLLVFTEFSANDVIPPWIGLPVIVAAVVVALRSIPGVWKMAIGGLVAGGVAGLLILGPGFRLSMRVVAIMDNMRAEEFTIGGTLFVILGIGVILGSIQGATAHVVRRVFSIDSAVITGAALGAWMMFNLTVLDPGISEEFFSEGAGAWVNIPLFSVFAISFGIAAMALASKFEDHMFNLRGADRVKVPA